MSQLGHLDTKNTKDTSVIGLSISPLFLTKHRLCAAQGKILGMAQGLVSCEKKHMIERLLSQATSLSSVIHSSQHRIRKEEKKTNTFWEMTWLCPKLSACSARVLNSVSYFCACFWVVRREMEGSAISEPLQRNVMWCLQVQQVLQVPGCSPSTRWTSAPTTCPRPTHGKSARSFLSGLALCAAGYPGNLFWWRTLSFFAPTLCLLTKLLLSARTPSCLLLTPCLFCKLLWPWHRTCFHRTILWAQHIF